MQSQRRVKDLNPNPLPVRNADDAKFSSIIEDKFMSEPASARRMIENLPIVDLMYFADFAQAKERDATLTRTHYGKTTDTGKRKFEGRIRKLEAYFGTFLLERTVTDPKSRATRPYRPRYPEELVWIMRQSADGKRLPTITITSELTLDGKIWASFAQNLFMVFDLTEKSTRAQAQRTEGEPLVAEIVDEQIRQQSAADRGPPAEPTDRRFRRQVWAESTPAEAAQRSPDISERQIPTRIVPFDRMKYLGWLSHKTQEIRCAWIQAQETNPFDLIYNVPGVEDPHPPADSAVVPEVYGPFKPSLDALLRLKQQAAQLDDEVKLGEWVYLRDPPQADHAVAFDPRVLTFEGQIHARIAKRLARSSPKSRR